MNDDSLKNMLGALASNVSAWLANTYTGKDVPERLKASMEYSLLAGGKRIRPVLCLASAMACQADGNTEILGKAMPFAAALELIHTYSLIHDDLPAMDDDDLRRGKPSNHRAFDEGTAILAGDALLTDAFRLMTTASFPTARLLEAVGVAAQAAGSEGMVGGQMLDLEAEGSQIDREHLADHNARKTGALLRAACECGAVLVGASSARRTALCLYGRHLGLAFQVTDDILDVIGDQDSLGKPTGSDAAQDKCTWPSLLGMDGARTLAAEQSEAAFQALPQALFPGTYGDFLRQLALYLVTRTH